MYNVPNEELEEVLTEDVFDSKYDLDDSIVSEHYDDGRLETFGADAEMVAKIHQESPNRLWTVIDGDDGGLYLVSGFHHINRVYHLVTVQECSSDFEEYLLG